jgi:hypothetical protein
VRALGVAIALALVLAAAVGFCLIDGDDLRDWFR